MTTTWTLQGISAGRGNCDHCGRTLARLFRIRHIDASESMMVGRVCSAKLTGYSWSVAQAERIEARKAAEAAALAEYGNLYAEAVMLSFSDNNVTAAWAGEVAVGLRDRYITVEQAEQSMGYARAGRGPGW